MVERIAQRGESRRGDVGAWEGLVALGGGELHDPVLHCENGVAACDLPLTVSAVTGEAIANLDGTENAARRAQHYRSVVLDWALMLKRFESSAFAFSNTLDTLIRGRKIFLEALGKGRVVTTRFLREIAAEDETILDDLLKASVDTLPARDFDTKALRRAVGADLAKLLDLRAKAAKVSAYRDPKLKVLVAEL